MGSHSHEPIDASAGIELRDANIPLVIWTTVGILFTLFLCMGIAALQFKLETAALPKDTSNVFKRAERRLPPEPRLQAFPAKDLAAFQERQRAAASTYGYIDKANGIVRVPVDRAIEMVMTKGVQVLVADTKPETASPRTAPPIKKAEAAKQ
ncbi:MAG: hypothetical protein NZV14_19000 [Bryobacteraceae bacterium]|nr:hypothetical protein [Bryobacteraceae bacterium]MDW8380254.1 hypothetical protein [Bryobacterales bacterium]